MKFQNIHPPNGFTFFVITHLKTAWAWHTTPSALLNKTEEQMAADLYLQSHSACLRIILFVKINLLTFQYFSDWNSWFKSLSLINIIITKLDTQGCVTSCLGNKLFGIFNNQTPPSWRHKTLAYLQKQHVHPKMLRYIYQTNGQILQISVYKTNFQGCRSKKNLPLGKEKSIILF